MDRIRQWFFTRTRNMRPTQQISRQMVVRYFLERSFRHHMVDRMQFWHTMTLKRRRNTSFLTYTTVVVLPQSGPQIVFILFFMNLVAAEVGRAEYYELLTRMTALKSI